MPKSKIECFWLEPKELVEISLRRYKGVPEGQPLCEKSGYGYHNASAIVVPQMAAPGVKYDDTLDEAEYPHDDPRWPKACACGYEFQEGDHWQVNRSQLFERSDTKELTTIHDAPVGAMWDAWWYGDMKGPDGKTLVVKTPGGDWVIDWKDAKRGQMWTRTGTPPKITANPSIGIGGKAGAWKYHGWLRNGVLEEC